MLLAWCVGSQSRESIAAGEHDLPLSCEGFEGQGALQLGDVSLETDESAVTRRRHAHIPVRVTRTQDLRGQA